MEPFLNLDSLGEIFVYLSAFLGAFLAAFWLSLVFWTYRDVRSRTRDRMIHIMATLITALLALPGLLIYLILRPRETLIEAYQRSLEEEALLSEIETRKVCPGCGAAVQAGWQLCAYCHTVSRRSVPNVDSFWSFPGKFARTAPHRCPVLPIRLSRPKIRLFQKIQKMSKSCLNPMKVNSR
jgi:hypothetical protein